MSRATVAHDAASKTPTPPLGPARVDAALWAALLGQHGFGVAVCDADGLLVEMNPTLEAMLGKPYQPSRAPQWCGLYRLYDENGEPLAPQDAPLLQALRGEKAVDRHIVTRPPDGSVRHLRCNGAQLYDAGGTPAGAVVFVTDITEQEHQRAELEALRAQLVETVNHELRTPAAVIKGHTEMLAEYRPDLPELARAHLDALGVGISRLEDVLNTIRELANRATKRRHGPALARRRYGPAGGSTPGVDRERQ